MKKSSAGTRLAAASLVAAAVSGLWGCPNPNAIGVQQYGTVQAACVLASNPGQPVANALVTVSTVHQITDGSGRATLTNVPIGLQQLLTADAPGLHGQTLVDVKENLTTQVTVQMSPTN